MLTFLLFLYFCLFAQAFYIKTELLRDTAQIHYESIVDTVLGQHNEKLLLELSQAIKDPHHLYEALKPEAELLLGSEPMQVCVAQMPGMIANQIHEQSSLVYNQIYPILKRRWLTADNDYHQMISQSVSDEVVEDLSDSLELLNMDITDDIIDTLRDFDMIGNIKRSLLNCQSTFSNTVISTLWSTAVEKKETKSLLDSYKARLISDLQSQLYSRVYELASSIYQDTI
ncbi:hypothetical protein G6F70_001668 [Rhizopus microsporus]|uniref:Uncharacterized protein n=2 Tax=Rhizopus TaxID=4842 RepID=A0A367K6N8_RHIAZ|nr:hypothetical protein G6F71_000150 [Rhizopus microsporus]RCH97799.1 hypothetical protein CU097_013995 [Rhizopus azygosporus]KAG1203118.1 hypothetical protein G6F70_001668 [Rhizopus microsporus]KAG1215006.1 hypothetical protein G6F69_001407 [Rhizopus microsporus]KAG1238431.1 hypothetical protein G6F67_000415 [Rhizopus microsporus]